MLCDRRSNCGFHCRIGAPTTDDRDTFTHRVNRVDTEIRCENDHGLRKIDRRPVPVCQPPVLEDLKELVEDPRVRLLDLVEENQPERLLPHRVRELSTAAVADVARRRTDQPGFGVLGRELTHVEPQVGVVTSEDQFRQRFGELGLAHPGRTSEEEDALWPCATARRLRTGQAHGRSNQDVDGLSDRCRLPLHAAAQRLRRSADPRLECAVEPRVVRYTHPERPNCLIDVVDIDSSVDRETVDLPDRTQRQPGARPEQEPCHHTDQIRRNQPVGQVRFPVEQPEYGVVQLRPVRPGHRPTPGAEKQTLRSDQEVVHPRIREVLIRSQSGCAFDDEDARHRRIHDQAQKHAERDQRALRTRTPRQLTDDLGCGSRVIEDRHGPAVVAGTDDRLVTGKLQYPDQRLSRRDR